MANKFTPTGGPGVDPRYEQIRHLAGLRWEGPTCFHQILTARRSIGAAADVFKDWVRDRWQGMSKDDQAWAKSLIYNAENDWHIVLMSQFMAATIEKESARQAA